MKLLALKRAESEITQDFDAQIKRKTEEALQMAEHISRSMEDLKLALSGQKTLNSLGYIQGSGSQLDGLIRQIATLNDSKSMVLASIVHAGKLEDSK